MYTQRNYSNKNNYMSFSEDKQIKYLIKEISRNYKNKLFIDDRKPKRLKTLIRNKSDFSPTIKNQKRTLEYSLSFKLKNKINKESLILELREELKYHIKFNFIYNKFLSKVIQLKEIVKENKEKVEENTNILKETFKDRFDIINNYEKTISLLEKEKKELVKTNDEIIKIREETRNKLRTQFDKIQEHNNEQRVQIEDLSNNINDLEYKRAHINDEMQSKFDLEEKKYEKYLKLYSGLIRKYKYFLDEYNTYCKSGEEITKIDVKLSDDTNIKNLLKEENLQIELCEKIIRKENLLENINMLKKRIKNLSEKKVEDKIKDMKHYCRIRVLDKNKIGQYEHIRKCTSNKSIKKKLNLV
jgi:hypothetical protein